MRRLGIDLGGTKMEAVVLSPEGEELLRHRVPTPKTTYPALLDTMLELINRSILQTGPVDSIGIGLPGAISPTTGVIKNANLLLLNGQDLLGDLTAHLSMPVKMANDADCLALSEFRDGAAKDASSSCFAAILGTGCGGGVVVNGALQTGKNRIAGEWGHNPLPEYQVERDGVPAQCYCQRPYCQESFLSGTGFTKRYNDQHGTSHSAKDIIDLFRKGELAATQHFELFIDQLARAFSVVINLIDPEVIVVGGGLSNVDEIYTMVPKVWNQYIFSDTVHTGLKKAVHGDSSGVRGAAWL